MQPDVVVGIGGQFDTLRNQHLLAPGGTLQVEPVAIIAQHVVVSEDCLTIDVHDLLELVIYFTEHLKRLDNLHRTFFQAIIGTKGFHYFTVDAGYGCRAEIYRKKVRLFVLQGLENTLSGCAHGLW